MEIFAKPLRSFLALGMLLSVSLTSCRSPEPIWNADGKTMTDLRTLRHGNRPWVQLDVGVKLYADRITFADKRRQTGTAEGRVFLDVESPARYKWLLEHGYGESASFDRRADTVSLAGWPMLEKKMMTLVATEAYTTMHVQWRGPMAHTHVEGPTRSDFAKSHPIPPEALPAPASSRPAPPVPHAPVPSTTKR